MWEVALADGTVAAFVQTEAEVPLVRKGGRFVTVYTAQDVGHILDALPRALLDARPQPKARRKATPNDLGAAPFDPEVGDPIPFGDPPPAAPQATPIADPDEDFPSLSAGG